MCVMQGRLKINLMDYCKSYSKAEENHAVKILWLTRQNTETGSPDF